MAELYRLDVRTENEDQAAAVTGLLTIWMAAGWEEIESGAETLIFRIYAENRDYLEQLKKQLELGAAGVECDISEVKKQDWTASWREFFTPVKCGQRFVVLPPWLSDADFGKRIKILIEPASAFGTGHHATTALCLATLSDLLDQGVIRKGQTFLDFGCGSGILGIGAALSGMTGLGVDNDALAVENALRNRELNGANSLQLRCGSLEQCAGKRHDLIMANILSEPLIEMSETLSGLLEAVGRLMLSGILDRQAEKVASAYEKQGRKLLSVREQDEWRLLLFE